MHRHHLAVGGGGCPPLFFKPKNSFSWLQSWRGANKNAQGVWCMCINPLTSNDHYSGRTASLTSKRCNLYIYSTNIGTEYFKSGIYSPFFLFKMQFVS